jgi:hypothetical protein
MVMPEGSERGEREGLDRGKEKGKVRGARGRGRRGGRILGFGYLCWVVLV